jgi:hypothetical protein
LIVKGRFVEGKTELLAAKERKNRKSGKKARVHAEARRRREKTPPQKNFTKMRTLRAVERGEELTAEYSKYAERGWGRHHPSLKLRM